MRYRNGLHVTAALATVTVVVSTTFVPSDAALGLNPAFCGKGVGVISAPAVEGRQQALAAKPDPYRVVATYYYKDRKQPQDTRVMRLGTSAWGFTHIRARRGWSTVDTYVIVGCVLTYGKPVGRQGHSYTFQYRFPREVPDQDLAGREYQVIYETSGAPKGVITAYDSGVLG